MENVSHNTSWSVNDNQDQDFYELANDQFDLDFTRNVDSPEFKSFSNQQNITKGGLSSNTRNGPPAGVSNMSNTWKF
jgi:hypothetical protein